MNKKKEIEKRKQANKGGKKRRMHRYEKGLLHGLKQWLRLCLLKLHRSRRKGEKEQRKEAGCDWQKKKTCYFLVAVRNLSEDGVSRAAASPPVSKRKPKA